MTGQKKAKRSTSSIASTDRRTFLAGSTAVLVSTLAPSFLTSCGGGGGATATTMPSPTPTPSPTATGLSIASVSSATPSALNPITLKLVGFDPSQPFVVSFSDPSGNQIAQTPVRAETDGTLVVPTPLHLDAATGTTSAFATTLTVSQNGQHASISITIGDIPQLSDFGVSLGAISRAFYIHQELALGASLNAQQAISGLPQIKVSNSTLTNNVQAQLNKVILARNDIDRIIKDNTVKIPIGTAPDGTAIFFDAHSVAMMDRVIAQYLLAYTADGTMLPASAGIAASQNKRGSRGEVQVPPAVMATILQGIQTLSGAVSFKSTQQTFSDPKSSTMDRVLSVLSTGASLVTVGASVIAIGAATVVDAPVIAVGAAAVATYASLAGVLVGSASMGNDLYNVGTNAISAIKAASGSPEQAAAIKELEKSGSAFASDAITTFLNAEGVGGVGISSIGPAAKSVFEGIFEPAAKDIALAGSGFLTSVANLVVQKVLSNDTGEAASGANSLGPSTTFGQVDGTVNISNNQGILSALPGVGAGNSGSGVNDFTCMAAPDGSYNLIIPIGDSSLTYNSITISAFDPISDLDLSSATVNLSGLNPNTPIKGPSLSGTCTDTDAGSPDSDDPDCD